MFDSHADGIAYAPAKYQLYRKYDSDMEFSPISCGPSKCEQIWKYSGSDFLFIEAPQIYYIDNIKSSIQ